jgi:hypothetical protein
MTQSCGICSHPDRKKIDQEIIKGTPLRDIAGRYGTSKSSLQRHQKAGHIPAAIAKAEEAKEVAQGDKLLRYTKVLLGKAISYMNQAEDAGDLRTACGAVREARACIELLGKVTGELGPNSQVNVQVNAVSLTAVPEWSVLMRVLERHPEIHKELSAALQEAGL